MVILTIFVTCVLVLEILAMLGLTYLVIIKDAEKDPDETEKFDKYVIFPTIFFGCLIVIGIIGLLL